MLGTVTETVPDLDGELREVPLRGVTVKLGSRSTVSGPNGTFKFADVPAGTYTLSAEMTGYETHTSSVTVRSGDHLQVRLAPTGGNLDISGTRFAALNGTSHDTSVTLRGHVDDFANPAALTPLGTGFGTLDTALTVTQLQGLINGTIHEIRIESNGSFEQEVPIDPGSNTIQLRVFDDRGNAYTTPTVTVTSTLERLDLRIVMNWDTDRNDVDLHLFKRDPNEPNPAGSESFDEWWTDDRHVYWWNKIGHDFGTESDQQAFLDIADTSGYGPETIVLQEATPGYYHIWVHFYSIWPADAANVTVDVILNEPGRDAPLHQTFTKELTENKEYWYVATVAYPAGEIIHVAPEATTGLTQTLGAVAPTK